jgi:hypothetical protein
MLISSTQELSDSLVALQLIASKAGEHLIAEFILSPFAERDLMIPRSSIRRRSHPILMQVTQFHDTLAVVAETSLLLDSSLKV